MSVFPPEAPQDYLDYFRPLALHAEPPSPKWAEGLKAAELWMAYHKAPIPNPELLSQIIDCLMPHRWDGSIFHDLWGVVVRAVGQLPAQQQIGLWRMIFDPIHQGSHVLKEPQRAEAVIAQWQKTIGGAPQATSPSEARALLAKLVNADLPSALEWMALARAIQAWLIAQETG